MASWLPGKRLSLLYRGFRDGMTADDFHRLCDDKGATVTLIQSTDNYIFGGYTSMAWRSIGLGAYVADASAFLFTVVNPWGYLPTRFPVNEPEKAVWHYGGMGPRFGTGADLLLYGIAGSALSAVYGTSHSSFPRSYTDTLGKGKATFTGKCSEERSFTPKEVEVRQVMV